MTAVFRDIEYNAIEAPKGRTFAAIRKACMADAARYRTPSDKDWQAMRAIRYLEAMRGLETPHSACDGIRHSAAGLVHFDKAPDGSRRVRSVLKQEIPHWDFVPTIVQHG